MKTEIEVLPLFEREDETPLWIEALAGLGYVAVLFTVSWLIFALQAIK